MEGSLFKVLKFEELTTLHIRYDWRINRYILFSAREWDNSVHFKDYNRQFTVSSTLIPHATYFGHETTQQFFQKRGEFHYLEAIVELMRKGKHGLLECYYWKDKDICFMSHVHNDTLGINNRRQAIRAGGIRRHNPDELEYEVIIDGLNLSRGMSFKNAAAQIPYGGSKFTVISPPVDLDDLNEMGFLSYAIDRCRVFTGPDMNYPPELADVMKKHFTLSITGGPQGPLGATGIPTAYGVYLAVKEAARFTFNEASLKDRTIAVMGLGVVGSHLADYYAAEGAKLIVADLNQEAIHTFITKHPNASIQVINPEDILFVKADIFSPAAVGGIITDEIIPRLKFKMILGGANNTLKASSQLEEYHLAKKLAQADILYQVDWWHNVGGVLCGCEEYENQEKALMDNVLNRTKVFSSSTYKNIKEAHNLGMTPTENAYKRVENLIYRH